VRLGSYFRVNITRRAYDTVVALQFLLIGAILKRAQPSREFVALLVMKVGKPFRLLRLTSGL